MKVHQDGLDLSLRSKKKCYLQVKLQGCQYIFLPLLKTDIYKIHEY